MYIKGFIVACVFLLVLNFSLIDTRSVTHRKDKAQATIDKEVLLEDEDYEDNDVMDLSPEEQKERLKKLVTKKIDVNQDGFVDLKELQAWSLKAFDNFETDDYKEEFSLVDVDKDGFVTWHEHEVDAHGEDDSPDSTDKKSETSQFKKDKKLFAAADLNGDEQLDVSEYLLFKIPRRHNAGRQVLIDDVLEKFDTDGDGAINLAEFLKENDHDSSDEDFAQSDKDRFNEELDENEDGILTEDEIVQWIDPDNREDSNDEADHLITECDTDNDHKLSPSEIIDNHDLWIESDATDYGRQLLKNHDEF